MDPRFNVVYCGELQPQVRAQAAVTGFAARFGIPEDRARRLLLDGQEHVLKRDVDAETAEAFRGALEEIGLVVRLVALGPRPLDLELVPKDPRAHEAPPAGALAPRQGAGVILTKATPPLPNSDDPPHPGHAPTPADTAPTAPHARGPRAGWDWIVRGFWHFKRDPWPWIGAVLLLYVLTIAVGLVPLVGGIASTLLGPMFTGGLMIGAQDQERGEPLRLEHLFAGLYERAGQLALIGVIYLVGGLVIALIVGLLMSGSLFVTAASLPPGTVAGADPGQVLPMITPALLLPLLVAMLLAIPLAMALFLAPPLVAIDGMKAVAAMRLSFRGCLKNILPLLLYGLIATALLVIGSLPLLLGLLVVMPILMASLYAAYRDIYFDTGWRTAEAGGLDS
ncbi:BPSS1780 family membrane protein [Thiococcus pfennigii]|uniref:BPSS1780 family membrane protein n=1 Tax=Thiococcus pfennigii TaxID=1057 RepID=UPI0019052CF0|nr:BPSS1780 family membrane protein [Thiococcus pfennigii]MBK1702307.1 hypothetical protein [Thiococcus pfennigii]